MNFKDIDRAKARVREIEAILDWELIRSYAGSQTRSEQQLQELKQEQNALRHALIDANRPAPIDRKRG